MCFILQLSFIDLSPDHAGTLYSVANFLSCMCLIASPYFTGLMIEEEVSHTTNVLHHHGYREHLALVCYYWGVPSVGESLL